MPCPAPFTQPCSSVAASHLADAVPTLHTHVTLLTTLSSPPGLVQTFPLPLSSSSVRRQTSPSQAGKGAFLLSHTVYYSKGGIWLGEETGGRLAHRAGWVTQPHTTFSPTCLWGGCAPQGLRSCRAQVPGATLGLSKCHGEAGPWQLAHPCSPPRYAQQG